MFYLLDDWVFFQFVLIDVKINMSASNTDSRLIGFERKKLEPNSINRSRSE